MVAVVIFLSCCLNSMHVFLCCVRSFCPLFFFAYRAQAVEVCDRIGFPCMIKASEGGGGKGIRKVEQKSEVKLAFAQVQGEVPGSPIFIMRLASECRHLEVQLLADQQGSAIAVFGRDCSIQRRHQKIIEEGPVLAAPPAVWREMERAAVRLCREVGYSGGTSPFSSAPFFLLFFSFPIALFFFSLSFFLLLCFCCVCSALMKLIFSFPFLSSLSLFCFLFGSSNSWNRRVSIHE